MRLPIGRRAVRRLQVLEIGRDDLIFGLGICTGLIVILLSDGLVYGWGRRSLFDGQVIPLLQVPLVDHPLFLQWSGIKVPAVTALTLAALGVLISLPSLWRPRLITAVAAGLVTGAAIIGLFKGTRYHHDLLLSLDVQPLGVLRGSLVLVPSALALLLLLVMDARRLWQFRQRNGPLPIAIEAALLQWSGNRHERKERFDQAERAFRRAYERVRVRLGENDPLTLGPLVTLAWFTYDHPADDGSEAGRLFRRGIALAGKGHHIDRSTMVQLIDGLGSVTARDGDIDGALRLYEEAVRLAEEAHGATAWQVATPLRHLAWATSAASKLDNAERLARQALAIARRSYGARSRDLVPFIATLANVRDTQGQLGEAASLREEAVRLAGQTNGQNTMRAQTLIDLGSLRVREGKYQDAEKLFEEALALASEDQAERRSVVPSALMELASLRRRERRYSEAEHFARRALEEQEDFWGRDSLQVVNPLAHLGDLCTKQNKVEEARTQFNRAIAIIEKRSGPADVSLARLLPGLAALEQGQGNYEVAETIIRRAIALTEAHYGAEDHHLVHLLVLLGVIASERESHTDAIAIFERGLILAEKAYGRNHPDTAQFLGQLAGERELIDDLEGSERLHREEISALQGGPEAHDSELAEAFGRLADFLERHDRSDEAVEAKRQSMEVMVKHAWENPADSI